LFCEELQRTAKKNCEDELQSAKKKNYKKEDQTDNQNPPKQPKKDIQKVHRAIKKRRGC